MLLPVEAQPLLAVLLPHFTHPTATRFVVLTAAAILTTGRRTVANLLRTVGRLTPGHDASYRRVLSAARWSGIELGCALARYLLDHLVPAGPVSLVGDDTVDGHPGRWVDATVADAVVKFLPSAEVIRSTAGPVTVGMVADELFRHPPTACRPPPTP